MIVIGIQARTGSTRLPSKIYKEVAQGVTLLDSVYRKCVEAAAKRRDGAIVSVLGPYEDGDLVSYCNRNDFEIHQPKCDEGDLVARYAKACSYYNAEAIVRVTSDCPCIPSEVIAHAMGQVEKSDYVTNVSPRTFPDGWDVQAMRSDALKWYYINAKEREHMFSDIDLDPSFRNEFLSNGFRINRIMNSSRTIFNPYHPDNKVSVDDEKDLERIRGWMKDGVKGLTVY